MTEIQQNRYDQLIRRVNNIVGHGSMVSDALAELFPVIDVERVPGELLILMGTDICTGSSSLTGAAGQVPKIQVFNPVGSGKIVTVTQAIFSSSVTTRCRMAISTVQLPSGVATQVFRDRRHDVTARPTAGIFQSSAVALTDAHILLAVLADESNYLLDENGVTVLNPGSGFEISTTATAASLTCAYFWRERVAEPAELNL